MSVTPDDGIMPAYIDVLRLLILYSTLELFSLLKNHFQFKRLWKITNLDVKF